MPDIAADAGNVKANKHKDNKYFFILSLLNLVVHKIIFSDEVKKILFSVYFVYFSRRKHSLSWADMTPIAQRYEWMTVDPMKFIPFAFKSRDILSDSSDVA